MIQGLHQPTHRSWIDQALAHLDTVLLDHAQCERKAAGVALSLINRYPS
ncbi:MAG TPA: tRNA-(ms[2]io[6]A)-hydroxylase, partial [Leptolyngbyaceae cyanobacterium M65_K2018_010]|nr:tRNA-(ms[2]io[6]A)-hydroxylase [Leptolyngbyaceae cyanobacterium M65_K2018_010]